MSDISSLGLGYFLFYVYLCVRLSVSLVTYMYYFVCIHVLKGWLRELDYFVMIHIITLFSYSLSCLSLLVSLFCFCFVFHRDVFVCCVPTDSSYCSDIPNGIAFIFLFCSITIHFICHVMCYLPFQYVSCYGHDVYHQVSCKCPYYLLCVM